MQKEAHIFRKVQDYQPFSAMKCGHLYPNKENKQWIWLAIDAKSKEIVGVNVGDHSRGGARKLWQSLPGMYR